MPCRLPANTNPETRPEIYDNCLAVSPNAETERILATSARFRLVPILRKYRLFLSLFDSKVNLSGKITQHIDIPRQNNSITDPLLIHY